jgi:hypothetical protein
MAKKNEIKVGGAYDPDQPRGAFPPVEIPEGERVKKTPTPKEKPAEKPEEKPDAGA